MNRKTPRSISNPAISPTATAASGNIASPSRDKQITERCQGFHQDVEDDAQPVEDDFESLGNLLVFGHLLGELHHDTYEQSNSRGFDGRTQRLEALCPQRACLLQSRSCGLGVFAYLLGGLGCIIRSVGYLLHILDKARRYLLYFARLSVEGEYYFLIRQSHDKTL